ncbi:MAG: hypothetical protein KAT23_00925 [Anaerolineales bacterium]|nr:hypothetical protein [Anaerolineales bacterium]
MEEVHAMIGRVTRCSIRGFVGAVRLPEPDLPSFGAFCKAEAQQGHSQVIGLIYDISIEDDEFARQMATAESLSPEQFSDHQYNRQVPVEFSALAIGYQRDDQFHYNLPPQPPLTLAPIRALTPAERMAFTQRLDFIPLILSAPNLPVDDLLTAALRQAAQDRSGGECRRFLLQAGRECARLLDRDLSRLHVVVRGLAE